MSPHEPGTEAQLQRIWSRLLDKPMHYTGSESSFLPSGGDSPATMHPVAAARELGIILNVEGVFRDSRPESISEQSTTYSAEQSSAQSDDGLFQSLGDYPHSVATDVRLREACGLSSKKLIEDAYSCHRPELLLFSAHTSGSLRKQAQHHDEFIQAKEVKPSDIAHTRALRREVMDVRAFSILRHGHLTQLSTPRKAPAQPPKVTLVFNGQGAQWAGMGKELLQEDWEFANDIGRMDRVLRSLRTPPTWSMTGEKSACENFAMILFANTCLRNHR